MAEKLEKKRCLHCDKTKNISEYYENRNLDETGVDCWCKSCLEKVATKEDMQRYMWENGREFTAKIWDGAIEKATPIAENLPVYQKSSKEKKKQLLERLACQNVPMLMNTDYHFIDTDNVSYEEAKNNGMFNEEEEKEDEKIFSKEFHGWFTKDELDFLENYMDNLAESKDIESGAAQDYARKMAKASLVHDHMLNSFLAGECSIDDVNKAAASFDMLAKSAELAPSKAKKDDGKGIGSWSELTLMLETNGHPCTRKIQWELDDVDKTVIEFRHIITAMGLDGE